MLQLISGRDKNNKYYALIVRTYYLIRHCSYNCAIIKFSSVLDQNANNPNKNPMSIWCALINYKRQSFHRHLEYVHVPRLKTSQQRFRVGSNQIVITFLDAHLIFSSWNCLSALFNSNNCIVCIYEVVYNFDAYLIWWIIINQLNFLSATHVFVVLVLVVTIIKSESRSVVLPHFTSDIFKRSVFFFLLLCMNKY